MVTVRSSGLALLGGTPAASEPWPSANTLGEAERQAVLAVLDAGELSGFRAGGGPEFFGGPQVRRLEAAWAGEFGVKHAVSFNSLTSGLIAAMGAIGVGPGDAVIVSPFTMSASATCPIFYGATPVFADIDPVTCCLDPASVEARITPRTTAMIIVHLFGHPADMEPLMRVAHRYRLAVVEDCAQAPAGRYRGTPVGTFGQIGGFSLNRHKTIQAGEGGVLVTDDDALARRLQLIRNHGETAVGPDEPGLAGVVGGNFRLTELTAAIATVQLGRLQELTEVRTRLAARLDERLAGLPGITPLRRLDAGSRHVYYRYAMRYDTQACGLPRELFVRAVCAEGIELRDGYVRPIYWEPLFQRLAAAYPKGLCPAAEAAYERDVLFGDFCRWPLTTEHADQVIRVFEKVWDHREELAGWAGRE